MVTSPAARRLPPQRRRALLLAPCLLLAAAAGLLPSCERAGNFTVFAYTTQPQYNRNITSVYVPIFKNMTFRRGLEFDLTRAVVRAIEWYTPYKVISDFSALDCTYADRADTELSGTIISLNKNILNRNQLNEV